MFGTPQVTQLLEGHTPPPSLIRGGGSNYVLSPPFSKYVIFLCFTRIPFFWMTERYKEYLYTVEYFSCSGKDIF